MRFEAFNYVECTIQAELTIAQYRHCEAAPKRRRRHRIPRSLKRIT